jgi:hypothetical protein
MATVNLTGTQVANFAAARLNDASQTLYTDAVQLPFLNIALAELQEIYEANNIPVTDTTSAVINVPTASAGIVTIGFTGTAGRILPTDLIEPKVVWESPEGLNQWITMTKLDYLPQYDLNAQISTLVNYQWATNAIKVLAANADNDIKLDYVRNLFTELTDITTDLLVQNSLSFLGNRVASLVASDIEENEGRSQRLYLDALQGLDRALTIPTKGRQRITTRRRPFRSGYKNSRMVE